jgi:hypothetical protein
MQPVVEQLKRMPEDRFLAMYESLVEQGFGPMDGNVAKALKFRPQAIRKLPLPQRARKARALLLSANDAELAYELSGSYLVKHHRDLVTGFLDATGVSHDDGMIEDLDASAPDEAKLEGAVKGLDERFDSGDVTLYLAMCSQQWPASSGLRELWQSRSEAAAAR